MFRPQMTDVSGNTTSQYAVVAPISVATDISPSRQTRESSNEFLQEHTIISELKKKDRAPGKLKYVDVEFNNVSTEQRAQITRKEGPTASKNVFYEDWTVPRPRPRKQPPPPPTTKPKPVSKAKSLAQMVVPVDTATISGETVKTKARCASESETVDDERLHQQQPQQPQVQSRSVNSLRRPSRKAPPPPKQPHQVQNNDKESVAQNSQKAKSPKPLRGGIGNDQETVDLAPLSPKQRRALSSEKEIVETTPLSKEHHEVKRTSSFKEAKSLRPVRKAPPPPNKSTECINVVKDEDDVTFSTFFVSHKKAQSINYENVVCDNNDASLMGTFPRSQAYENMDRSRKVHRSDEGQHRNYSHSYENVASTRQAIEDKLNKSRPNTIDVNKVDNASANGGDTVQHQQETPRSNGGIHYQKQGGKKKSVRKKRNISPPRTPPPPPPPPPEATGGLSLSPPEATSELTSVGSPPTYSKLKRPMAPPPPPPGAIRQPGTPPPRPPPPDETQPPNVPPPPDEMQPPNFAPPPPPVEMQPPNFTPPPPPVTMQPPNFIPAPPPAEMQLPNFTPSPPPVEMQPPDFTPPPPPSGTQLVNGTIPPRPPPPTDETKPVPLTRRSISKKQPNTMSQPLEQSTLSKSSNSTHSRVAPSEVKAEEQVFPTASTVSKSAPLSPPLVMAKKPLTSPPATRPPPPPVAPGTPSDQKCVSFEIPSSDGEVESPSISTSSSEESFHQQQVIRQQQNGDVDNDDLHADIITNYTTPPDFFGQPSRELDPITEYADTESSGSVYITRTVSDEALNWNSDQQLSADNSPDLRRLGGEPTSEGSASVKLAQKAKSPLVEMNKTATENGRSVSQETNHKKTSDTVEQQSPPRERKESGASPFWYRESMIMAFGRGNALHGYSSKKRPLPPPRSSQSVDPPLIENMESSPSRVRRPPENSAGTEDMENNVEDVEISLAYTNSTSSNSSSAPCPIPPPRVTKETKALPPTAPPRDRSSLSSSPARNPEKSKAAFTRVRAASFLTVSAGKELNTVTAMYMGSKQVDQFTGQITNIARDLSEKPASPMILYIATEKIRLAAPDSNVLFASFAVENILATTLCSINKRIVGMLVWKSRALPSWHLIRCNDNLVAGSVLESIQMACETVKSDEITEVSHDICGFVDVKL